MYIRRIPSHEEARLRDPPRGMQLMCGGADRPPALRRRDHFLGGRGSSGPLIGPPHLALSPLRGLDKCIMHAGGHAAHAARQITLPSLLRRPRVLGARVRPAPLRRPAVQRPFRSARANTSVSRPQPLAPSRGRGAGSTHQWRKASEAMCALISGMASNFSTYDLRFGYSSRMVGSKQMSASRVCHACGTRGGQRELRRAGGPRGGPRLRARRTWKSAIVMFGPAAYSAVKNLSRRFSLAGTVSRKPFLSSGPNSGL